MFVCVGVVSLPAGDLARGKPNERAAADYDVTGLAAPAQRNRKLAKPLSSMDGCFYVYLSVEVMC